MCFVAFYNCLKYIIKEREERSHDVCINIIGNMESIKVKNYRSIADSGEIDLRPLTVVVGKNSAGKSSFIRLLPLLKQTLERKTSDTLLWYGDYVDFGDFQHTVSNCNKQAPIEISFSIMTYERFYGRYLRTKDKNEFLVKVKLAIREKYIEKVDIKFFDQCISVEISEEGKAVVLINGDEKPYEKKELVAFRETQNIIPSVFEERKNLEGRYYGRGVNVSELVAYCKKYIYPEKMVKKEELVFTSLYDGIDIKLGSKSSILKTLKQINEAKFKKMTVNHKRFQKINNYIIASKLLDIIERINTCVINDMKQTSYLKPIRAMVNRYYRVQGISIDELDADGSNLPMILKNMTSSELLDFEQWSKDKFGVVFSVTSGEGHISLIIKNDVGGNVETNVADTGYGYSQMLPIVMMLWMIHKHRNELLFGSERTLVIEQPELHLHPAYQAKMIDVFINIIKEAERNKINIKIIFETHSETMINRIGTLISEKKILAEKVNVLIFDKINNQTHIVSKKFNSEGLLMGWPIGFFAAEED